MTRITRKTGVRRTARHIGLRSAFSIVGALLLFVWVPSPAFAAAGDLDNSFGGDGKVTTFIAPGPAEANAVALQADGKIVAAGNDNLEGESTGDNSRFALARYNTDGTLDTTFGQDGIALTNFTPHDDHAFGVAIQPDGKIVAVGYSGLEGFAQPSPDYRKVKLTLARYNSDGSLDSSFGSHGKVRTDIGSCDDYAFAVAIQSDGKIVAAGQAWSGVACGKASFALTRYNSDGTPDATFGGGDGKVTTDFTSGRDQAFAAAIQPDGKIVLAGVSHRGPHGRFALARYNADGTLDTTFGGNGKVTTDFPGVGGLGDEAHAVSIQTDGKILVAGNSALSFDGSTNPKFALARYNGDGTLDTTFGGDGTITTDFTPFLDFGRAVVIQADGKIVMAGSSGQGGANAKFALTRYNSDGTLDTTFGGDGKITTDLTRFEDIGSAVVIQADGKIVVAGVSGLGGSSAGMAVARYVPA